MYAIYINENEIMQYNGDILKRYIGNRLVKTIANPTDENLLEFGFKEVVETEIPEYNTETQCLTLRYEDGEQIRKVWTVKDIEEVVSE